MRIFRSIIKAALSLETNNFKGAVGERQVSAKLNPALFGKVEHKQINNLTLVDESGKSHQIDHVEIRENGIFCIETKNYSGWIFGNENQQMWTQTLYNEKHQFYNPIKQNRSHIYYLGKALGGKYKVNSVIVMTQNNADRIEVPYVVNLKDLRSYLANFNDGTKYSQAEMTAIYEALLRAQRNDISRKDHIQNIQDTRKKISAGNCPRCGNPLVLRTGTYGKFYGCSNYPNCRFTKNI